MVDGVQKSHTDFSEMENLARSLGYVTLAGHGLSQRGRGKATLAGGPALEHPNILPGASQTQQEAAAPTSLWLLVTGWSRGPLEHPRSRGVAAAPRNLRAGPKVRPPRGGVGPLRFLPRAQASGVEN